MPQMLEDRGLDKKKAINTMNSGRKKILFLMVGILVGFAFLLVLLSVPVSAQGTIHFIEPTPQNQETVTLVYVNTSINTPSDSTAFIDWNRSLLLWLNFENSFGTVVYDSSSHAHHGTLVNEAHVTNSDKRGKAARFDGSSDYISFSDASAHKPEEFTISFWIKSDGTIQDDWIVSKQVSGSSDYNYGYLIRLDTPSNNVICMFGYGSSRVSISYPLNPNTWHHVACTYDGVSVQLFVDGELKRNRFISESIDYSNVEALSIGAGNTGSLGFKGFIDELVLFSRALSESEIKALYNSRYYRLEKDFYDSRYGNYQLQAFVIDEGGVISQTEKRTIIISHLSWCNYDHHCNFSSGENYQTCPYDCPFDISSRPRLLLTQERINLLKSRINSQEPSYIELWAKFKSLADKYAKETPPSQSEFAGMWEGSLRQYGNKMPYISLAYLLTEDQKYLDGARVWMDALSNYPDWGNNKDLAASHILFGMSITYDWLYDEFTEEERVRYRNKMIYHTDILYDNLVRDTVWWAHNYQQNHNHVNSLGIMAAAVALYGDGAKSKKYIGAVYDNFGAVLDILPPDGSWSEGVSYYTYALYALNNYFTIEKYLYGYDRRLDSDWFRNTIYYRLYASVPGYVKVITFADSVDFDWYCINGLLSDIGSSFNNLYAQWLGEKVREVRDQYNYKSYSMYKWPALIYYNESLEERAPYDLPTYWHFYDLGLFTSRSSWEDDEAIFVAFKAGPPIGHHAEDISFAKGSGHVRPDEGEFLLYAFGKEMIIDKIFMNLKYIWTTSAHNTITFDTSEIGQGIGQLGETYYDPPGFRHNNVRNENGTVDIIHTDFTNYYEYLVANLTRIYPKALEIKNFVRHFLFVNKSILFIIDEIESESPHDIHWHIHTPRTGSVSSYNRKFVFSEDNVGFRLDDISEMNLQRVNEVYNLTYPESHPYYYGNYPESHPSYGKTDFYETNRIRLTAPQTTNVKIETVIRPYKNNVPDDLEISRSNGYVNIVSGNITIHFSADERKVYINNGLTAPPPTNGGDGGDGGNGYPIFKPTQIQELEEGYEKTLIKNWKIEFEFNNETYTIKLDNIINKTAIITISSGPVTFNLTINETKKLSLDDNNYYDLQIFLKDISDYEADLVVKLIHEEKVKWWIWLVLALIIVVLVIIIIVFVRLKKSRQVNREIL